MTLVLITMAAGRVDGEETKIRLYWIDRVKTEVIFVALLLFVVLTTVAGDADRVRGMEDTGNAHYGGNHDYVCDSVFLALYLSLVRRVKAEVLWKSSLLYWLICGITKIIKNIRLADGSLSALPAEA